MKNTRRSLALLLAAFMLFACVPGFAANDTADEEKAALEKSPAADENVLDLTSGAEFPEPVKGDVYDGPISTISLTDAANPAGALRVVDVATENYEWGIAFDEDMERYVASASISTAAGSYTRTLSTGTLEYDFTNAYPVMFLRAYVGTGGSISIVCVDEATGSTWTPYYYSLYPEEYDRWIQRGVDLQYNSPGSGVIRFHVLITYTYSISRGGDTEYPSCRITNLQVANGYSADEMGNAPDSDLKLSQFVYYSSGVNASLLDGTDDHGFIYMHGNSDNECICGISAHVTAERGDVLSFDYISSLDYMAGSVFRFGTASGPNIGDFEALFEGEDEGGEGYYSSSGPSDWASWSYTIPANGEYDFIWMLDSYDNASSELYVSNIRVTPRMSPERALNEFGTDMRYHNGEDAPWVPCYFRGEFCMKSGPIGDNGTSTLISEGNMLKRYDHFEFRVFCSSEEEYDFFRVYSLNTSDPDAEEELVYEASGLSEGWAAIGATVETPGIYTFRFEYSKDYSASDYDDCAYLDFVHCTDMTQTHAFCATDDDEESINAWDYYPENYYRFLPVLFNGEVVLASNNQGEHNTSAYLNTDVEMDAYDTFAFEYMKDAESNYDNLTIYVDGDEYAVIKPRSTVWQQFSYASPEAGTHHFEFVFHKDVSVNSGTDTVYLRNARLIPDGLNEALQEDYQGEDYLYHASAWAWFTPMEVDGRYAVGYEMDDPDNEAEVGVFMDKQVKGFQYVTFEYKLVNDTYISLYIDNEYIDEEFIADGQWHRYYYRAPQTGTMAFRLNALVNSESAAYLDNFYVGYLGMDIEDAVDTEGATVDLNVDSAQGFSGVYDPLFSINSYIAGRTEPHGRAVFEWDQYLAAGDLQLLGFCFLDEDGQTGGSNVYLYMDDVEIYAITDGYGLLNHGYTLQTVSPCTGDHHFKLVYYPSSTSAPGDCLAITSLGVDPVGVTLDEALNVEGGDLHFEEADGFGGFVPYDSDGRYVGLPYAKLYPDRINRFDYQWGFETENELYTYSWVFLDMDGDGHNWERFNANDAAVCVDANSGEWVLKSASYEPGVYALTPDNWAISPPITIPAESLDTEVIFSYSGTNETWYNEHFAVYVLTTPQLEEGDLVFETTIDQPGWNGVAISLDAYAGQTVYIGIRHYDSDDVYWLFIDDFRIVTLPTSRASVSFDVDVHYGDMLCYELMFLPVGNGWEENYYTNFIIEVYSERCGLLTTINAWDLLMNNHYLNEWIPCCITLPYSGEDTITINFRLLNYNMTGLQYFTYSDYYLLNADLDNVKIVREEPTMIGDVDCDGVVTFSDVGALYNYLIGGGALSYQGRINADVNGDGSITFADVGALYSFILGS